VAPSEDEIRRRLAEFAARWGGYQGSERSEAQTFLNQLLECYGVDRQAVGARFDDGAYRDLSELHVALDEAVAAAYGWPASAAHDPQESNRLLLELNREIAEGRVPYDPFRGCPGTS
jgi:hypothetical protein